MQRRDVERSKSMMCACVFSVSFDFSTRTSRDDFCFEKAMPPKKAGAEEEWEEEVPSL